MTTILVAAHLNERLYHNVYLYDTNADTFYTIWPTLASYNSRLSSICLSLS